MKAYILLISIMALVASLFATNNATTHKAVLAPKGNIAKKHGLTALMPDVDHDLICGIANVKTIIDEACTDSNNGMLRTTATYNSIAGTYNSCYNVLSCIIYVNLNAVGSNNGTSWANAFTNLQNALMEAQNCPNGAEIWVAQGTYYPDEGPGLTDNDRDATFQLLNRVAVYGGFTGTESTLAERDWENNPTILSGDINQTGDLTGNAYSVVNGSGTYNTAVIDGFTITAGNADFNTFNLLNPNRHGGGMYNNEGSPTVSNNTFLGNSAFRGGGMYNALYSSPTVTNSIFSGNTSLESGGGMYNVYGSSPIVFSSTFSGNMSTFGGGMFNNGITITITNCTFSENMTTLFGAGIYDRESSLTITNSIFSGNTAGDFGGGMYIFSSSPTITNCTFSGNTAGNNGGGMNISSSSPVITNCTFSGNTASNDGGGIYNSSSPSKMTNCIIWNNTANGTTTSTNASFFNSAFNATFSYSLIANSGGSGNWNGAIIDIDGGNNIDADPRFTDAANGDFSLQASSPAINVGSNADYQTETGNDPTNDNDLAGNPRLFGNTIDMGAFESQELPCPPNNILYVQTSATGNNDGTSWSNAYNDLQDALDNDCTGVTEIWVAAGTYKPSKHPANCNGCNSPRDNTFQLKDGIALYGGFDGTETLLSERDIDNNTTILSGDYNDDDTVSGSGSTLFISNNNENAYHVVLAAFPIDDTTSTTRLDGFTVTGGNANVNEIISINGVTFSKKSGGGIYTLFGNNTIENNTIEVCKASFWGGGIYLNRGVNKLTNNTVSVNTATSEGGGVYILYGTNIFSTNNISNNSGTPGSGGGMYFYMSNSNLEDNVISMNTTSIIGGGLYFEGGTYQLSNNTIEDNSASIGGGIRFLGGHVTLTNNQMNNNEANLAGCFFTGGGYGEDLPDNGTYIFNGNTISGNTSTSLGGAAWISRGSYTFTNNTISNNTAVEGGGGLFIRNSTTVFNENTISGNAIDNTTGIAGGGIVFLNGTNTLSNNTIADNSASNAGGILFQEGTHNFSGNIVRGNTAIEAGGGIITVQSTNTISNNSFYNNTADIGGGMYLEEGTNTLFNNSITGNAANTNGGGMYFDNSSPTITNTIIWNNTTDGSTTTATASVFNDSSSPTYSHSLIANSGGSGSWNTTIGTDGGNNIDANPLFVDAGNGDLRLQACSPAINAGSNAAVPGDITTDLNENPRFYNNGIVDMGAYEYQDEPTPVVAVCQNLTVSLDNMGEATLSVSLLDSSSTGCGNLDFTVDGQTSLQLSCEDIGSSTVILTVTDERGIIATCSATVTVQDIIQPTFTCPSDQDVNLDATCQITIPNLIEGLMGTDNCGIVTFTQNPAAGSLVSSSHNATTTLTVTVNDGNGNTSDCTVTLTAKDFIVPTMSCPDNISINTDPGQCNAVVMYTPPVGTDNCSGAVTTRTAGPESGAAFPVGMTMVTHEVEDLASNKATCSFTVTVTDHELPNVQCFDQTIIFNGENIIPLDEDDLLDATDNCGIQSISLTPNSISSNQVGQSVPVVVTVTDNSGNTSSCTSQISVSGLPSGWSQNANGVGCAAGNDIDYNASNSTWTATSTNCYYTPPYTSDAAAFAQYYLCGNGSITAQVTGISGTSLGWAGVVMRESNAPGAKKAQLTTNMSNFSRREFRTTTNGTAFPQQFPSQNRRWLRIVRSGNQFVMYVSPNGVNWAFAGTQNIQMNSCIEIGLVVTNYSSNSTVTATFANVGVTGGNTLSLVDDRESALVNSDDQQSFRDVKVYPNPTSGQLNIALTGYEGRPVTLEVYNTMGQMLSIKEVDEVQNADEIIDLSSAASGMYLIRVSSDGLPAEMKRVTVAR